MGRFKEWFFKGRIEKARLKQKRIDILSQEYNQDKILTVVNPDEEEVEAKQPEAEQLQAQDWINNG